MQKYFSLFILFLLCAFNLCAFGNSNCMQTEISAAEYEIYAAVIEKMYAGGKMQFDTQGEVKLLVIEEQTARDYISSESSDPQRWDYLREQFPDILPETFDSFTAQNKARSQLTDRFKIQLPHTFLKSNELKQIFPAQMNTHKDWEEFYRRFPDSGGYLSVSRAGFSPDEKQALVYVVHHCRSLCGSGHYVALARESAGWKVTKIYMSWIS